MYIGMLWVSSDVWRMSTTMKPVQLTDVLDIGDVCQMSVVLEIPLAA